jgi:hypothetical protein
MTRSSSTFRSDDCFSAHSGCEGPAATRCRFPGIDESVRASTQRIRQGVKQPPAAASLAEAQG